MVHKTLSRAFGLLILLLALHLMGSIFYYYWEFWWFDNFMHFLGSFALGLFIIWFVFLSELFWKSVPNKKTIFFAVILSMIVIGGVWELFEYTNNLTESTEGYTKDVVHDMISVFVGAVLAGYVGSRENKNV